MLTRMFTLVLVALVVGSCAKTETEGLVIYSGRSRSLVEDLVQEFEEETGIEANVRYGNDAELLAVLNEEGDRSPADIYWANTTGALANATKQGLLATLPDSLLAIPESYSSSSGTWIPVTVRFRVLAYNSENIDRESLPESVFDIPDMEGMQGRIGWTPTYSSFYDFITSMRMIHGEDSTKKWLLSMQNLEPRAYGSNTPMIQALAAGEIDIALTNHYYVLRMKYGGAEGEYEDEEEEEEEHEEEHTPQPNVSVETYHFAPGDIGNLALVTGASLLNTSDKKEQSLGFLEFLLSKQAQAYAVDIVHEYPVVKGVSIPGYMLQDDRAFELSPDYDYEQLQNLDETLNLLREAGLI